MERINTIRNIAIIAHVDHGKTTLVDFLLKQSNTFRAKSEELSKDLIMDSNDLERERGITILAKNTAIIYSGIKINIIDTPGHADFGGEVERTLNMADGALLLVDAQEGPMPQTKFVLKKALELKLKIIVVINKIDKTGSNIDKTIHELSDLFLTLATSDDQLDFPIIYAIGREGKTWEHLPTKEQVTEPANLDPLFKKIIEYMPGPLADNDGAFQMLVSNVDWDNFQGKYAIGRIVRGSARTGLSVAIIDHDGNQELSRIGKVFTYQGLNRTEVPEVTSGDIVALTGLDKAKIGSTIADAQSPEAILAVKIEEPTLRVKIGPNTSPFMGQDGKLLNSRQIGDRLTRELETNVSLRVEEFGNGAFMVSGRGELHLSILIETLRREGFELEVSKPEVIFKEIDGEKMEPMEEVTIDVPEEFVGVITTEFGKRKAELVDMINHDNGYSRMIYHISTRGFLGLRNTLVNQTKGTVIINSIFLAYAPLTDVPPRTRNGVLIASEPGKAVAFGLEVAQGRGTVFISPQAQVYQGMIIGLNSRKEDIEINVCKEKQQTNHRSSGEGTALLGGRPGIG